MEFLTPPYGFAYKRAKQIGVVTRNESVRIRQSRPVANGCQEPALATLAAVSGAKALRTVDLFSGALRRSDARRSVGNAVEIRNSAWIGVGVLTRLGDAAGTLVAEFGQNSATFGVTSVPGVRGEIADSGRFWQSSSFCILPPWTFLTIGRLTRCSVCWMLWRRITATRHALRCSSCGAPVCGCPRSSNLKAGSRLLGRAGHVACPEVEEPAGAYRAAAP